MYIAILGRQPALGAAELERVYGDTRWFSDQSAIVNTPSLEVTQLGGTQKAGRIIATLPSADWRRASMQLVKHYSQEWRGRDGKITLGISAYGFTVSSREVQKTGLVLKSKLKESSVSLRLIPNAEPALNTATSHHNKLGLSDNKVELLVVRARNGRVIVAESVGAQNITALARRDQERPKRDAFVGMLPPKLAQIMINLAAGGVSSSQPSDTPDDRPTILDPFCGTGVILQESLLLGYNAYGTDLAPKMIDFSQVNLEWIKTIAHIDGNFRLHQGDAMTTAWQPPISAVACESYLGQPFSAPPSPAKLREVRGNCNNIISAFLTNIHGQLAPGTPLCVGVPAWRDTNNTFTHLPLAQSLHELGYERIQLTTAKPEELLYYREDQVVARELLVMRRI